MSNFPCHNRAKMPLFYSEYLEEQMEAATLCFDCPFMIECGRKGESEAWGVWGGTTEWDRPGAAAAEKDRQKAEDQAEQDAADKVVLDLHAEKWSTHRIAKHVGQSQSNVWRTIDKHRKRADRERQRLEGVAAQAA